MKKLTMTAALVAAIAAAAVAAPAQAEELDTGDPACFNSVVKWPQASLDAFAGHRIVANAKVCLLYGPPGGIVFTSTPTISFPTRIPVVGLPETLSVTSGPNVVYESRDLVTYRISVKQEILKVGTQQFDFDIRFENAGAKICFTAGKKTCGPVARY